LSRSAAGRVCNAPEKVLFEIGSVLAAALGLALAFNVILAAHCFG
jgi:hypothetical protein